MRLVLLLLLCLTQTTSAQMFSPHDAWDWACEWSPYSCEGVTPPRIVIGMPEGQGGRGTYADGVVFLNTYLLPGVDMQSTTIHEMVHHLQHVVAGHPSSAYIGTPEMKILCGDEAEAFKIVDTWWRAVGQSDRQRGKDWWVSYSHCYKYYDPDWEDSMWGITFNFDGLLIEIS